MIAYLAGPISGASESDHWWRKELTSILCELGVWVFDPYHAFSVVDSKCELNDAQTMEGINRTAIDLCDILVAYMDSNAKAFGTIREVEAARRAGKKVILVGCVNSASSYDCFQIPSRHMSSKSMWEDILKNKENTVPLSF